MPLKIKKIKKVKPPLKSTPDTCPFCGGECKAYVGMVLFNDVIVTCNNCGAAGPIFDDHKTVEENMAAAVIHWNTRV